MNKRFVSLLVIGGALMLGAPAHAIPVDYVKVCSLYGPNFYYLPGTDVCYNVTTGETRQQTVGGTWFASVPNAAVQWVPNAPAGCIGGTLVNLGTLHGSEFAFNSHQILEAALPALTLNRGDFIASFMMSGGMVRVTSANGVVQFTGIDATVIPQGTEIVRSDNTKYITTAAGTIGDGGISGQTNITASAEIGGLGGVMTAGTSLQLVAAIAGVNTPVTSVSGFDNSTVTTLANSDLCMAFTDSAGAYTPLGCEDVTALEDQGAIAAFTPRKATPPATLVPPIGLVAAGRDWVTGTVQGELALFACVRNTSATGAACDVTPSSDASGVTLACGPTSAKIASGACSVADKGNGTATMSCPDGSSVSLLTHAPKESGCNSAPGASGALVAAAALLRVIRSRRRTSVE